MSERLKRAEIRRRARAFGYRGKKSQRNRVSREQALGLVSVDCEYGDDDAASS